MMRSRFDQQLATLHRELTQMGSMCEEIIAYASAALTTGDRDYLEKIGPLNGEIEQMERSVESLCLKLLLQQQPVARDLRQVSAALKMVTDMERIGTQCADIGELISFLDRAPGEDWLYIRLMAEATIRMVTESVSAFVEQDVTVAAAAIEHDDVVDDYFLQVKSSLIQMIAQRPAEGEHALDLLMIAKYFERIGDHAVNIARWVVFSITGHHAPVEEVGPTEEREGRFSEK